MSHAASLQETIAKGKRHYYDGLTFRKWKMAMLSMYGHDTTPFLDQAWNAIIGEAESRARANRHTQSSSSNGAKVSTRSNAKRPVVIIFFGNITMLTLNAIACLALFRAWNSRLPYSLDTNLPWLCFAAFTFSALWKIKHRAALICLPLACLFNPFYPFHLPRNIWSIVEFVSLLLLVAMTFSFLANTKK